MTMKKRYGDRIVLSGEAGEWGINLDGADMGFVQKSADHYNLFRPLVVRYWRLNLDYRWSHLLIDRDNRGRMTFHTLAEALEALTEAKDINYAQDMVM